MMDLSHSRHPMDTCARNHPGLLFRHVLKKHQRAQLFRVGASPKDMNTMLEKFLPHEKSIDQARRLISDLFPWIGFSAARYLFDPLWTLMYDPQGNHMRFWIILYMIIWSLRQKLLWNKQHRKSRPLSLTMPWNIGQRLAVLWGVCWMFYYQSTTTLKTNRSFVPLEGGQVNLDLDDFFSGATGAVQHRSPDSIAHFAEEFRRESFDFQNDDITESLNSWLGPSSDDFESIFAELSSTVPVPQGSEHRSITIPASLGGISWEITNHPEMTVAGDENPLYTTHHTNFSDQPQSSTIDGDHRTVPDASITLLMNPVVRNLIAPTTMLPPSSSNDDQWVQPIRDSEGRMICNQEGCNKPTFQTMASWESHMNKHIRPFKCKVVGCNHPDGFGTKGLLQRHTKSKHRDCMAPEISARPSSQVYYCPELSCNRSSLAMTKKPFARKDNRDDHVERQHKDLASRHQTSSLEESLAKADDQCIADSSSSVLRGTPRDSATGMLSIGKKRRLETTELPSENAESANEELHRLREEAKEVEELRRKVRKLEQSLESSRERENTLFDVIKSLNKST